MALTPRVSNICRLPLGWSRVGVNQITGRHYRITGRRLDVESTQTEYRHNPSAFDKRMLVLAKNYKTVDEVPETVTYNQMKRAKDWFRIRVNIYMAIATAIMGVVFIYIGKRQAQAGDSVERRGREWHKKNKEEYEKQKAAQSN